MLRITETFESFNALIRALSIHSNHQAPSRDIAIGFANASRIRHLLSGGKFSLNSFDYKNFQDTPLDYGNIAILDNMKQVGSEVKSLLESDVYLQKIFAVKQSGANEAGRFKIDKTKQRSEWRYTLAKSVIITNHASAAYLENFQYTHGKSFSLPNGDICQISDSYTH